MRNSSLSRRRVAATALASLGLVAAQCATPVLTISTANRNFGSVAPGASATRTFVVTNTGGFDALLRDVSTAGVALATPFSVSGGSCATGASVPVNGSCTIDVRFSPTTLSFADDRIELKYNWLNSNQPDLTVRSTMVGNATGTAAQLTSGRDHACILTAAGAVRCWGENGFGALGYGNREHIGDDEFPGSVGNVSVGGTVMRLESHYWRTCAILSNGALRCWGLNQYGELGYGVTEQNIGDDELPSSAGDVLVGAAVQSVAIGDYHVCALLTNGNVRCWGHNGSGQLGLGHTRTIGDDEPPSSGGDVEVGGRVLQLIAGGTHTCALLDAGRVRCWGFNGGALGYGHNRNIGDDETPASAGDVPVGGKVTQLTAGDAHTCALLDTGAVRCWGNSRWGRLGYGNEAVIGDDETPASVGDVNVGGKVAQIDAGGEHTCAVLTTGAVRCWGSNVMGELGYGHTFWLGSEQPPAAFGDVSVGAPVRHIEVGFAHTCALLTTGKVRCWGFGGLGVVGQGSPENIGDNELPSSVGDIPLY